MGALATILAMVSSGLAARLGATNMPAAALSSDVVSWVGQFDNIFVIGGIPNYQGSDAASVRFGLTQGVVDSTNSYWWRSLFVPAGGQTISENPNGAADTLIQLGEKTAQGRVFAFHVINFATKNKVLKAWNAIGTSDAPATKGDAMISLEGVWAKTSGSIQCMQLVTLTNKMGAGSQFSVWGLNSQSLPY
jgi:hypothetical protein